jgi:hypothetical protein
MEQIIYLDGIITYRGSNYPYYGVEKVDDYCVHVHMGEGIYAFVGGKTILNGSFKPDADSIISALELV